MLAGFAGLGLFVPPDLQAYVVSAPRTATPCLARKPKGKMPGAKAAVALGMTLERGLGDIRGICNFEAVLVDLQRPDLRL